MDAILLHRRTAEKGLKKIFKLISNIKQSIFNRKLYESENVWKFPYLRKVSLAVNTRPICGPCDEKCVTQPPPPPPTTPVSIWWNETQTLFLTFCHFVLPNSYFSELSELIVEITLFHTALKKVQEPILILLTAGWGILYLIDKSHTPSYISIHNLIKLRIDLLLHRKYWNCDGAGNGYHQFCGDGMVRHLAFHLFILI